jgi:hypothetical protein
MPRALFESSVFVGTLYFMVGFSADVGRFFLFLLLIFVGSIATSAWLRMVAFTARTAEVAAGLGMPIACMQVIFGGFLLTSEQVPRWLLGAYWASPFSWVFRALILNEVNDPAYDIRPPPGIMTLGQQFLAAFEIQPEQKWIGAAVGFCFAYFLLGIVLTGAGITYIQHDDSLGSSRAIQVEEDVPHPGHEAVIVGVGAPHNLAASSALPFTPASMCFTNLKYTVNLPRNMGGGSRTLLQGVNGYATPGTVTFLMGASGAGTHII